MDLTKRQSLPDILDYIKESKKKEFLDLMEEARNEAHQYFNDNIRELPKNEKGEFEITKENKHSFYDNDVDAFRHAYASGIFTQVYNRRTANLLGWYNEYKGTNPINVQNMDLWNNSIGRKYGEKTSSRTELSQLLVKALEEELIIDPKDPREYKGLRHFDYDPEKPVEVIDETETGLNNTFFDLSNGTFMKRKEFIAEIKSGNYKGYQIVQKGNLEFPISKPDKVTSNNLG